MPAIARGYTAGMADKKALAVAAARRISMGAVIKDLAETKGLNVKQLAERVGISAPAMSMVLAGKRGVKPETLTAIAAALGVTTAQLDPDTSHTEDSGLERFIKDYREALGITPREEWYLRQSRFRAEEWVTFGDDFWRGILEFWRSYLAKQEHSGRTT